MGKISRRSFLVRTAGCGAALALAPVAQAVNRLIPYVNPPTDIRPGAWALFATCCRECPAGCGMVLRHRDGRVTKAEGIPDHPLSRGGLCPRGQSCVQGLYDPDRVRAVLQRGPGGNGGPSAWPQALAAIAAHLRSHPGRVALMSDLQTGSLAEVMAAFCGAFGSDRLIFFEPFRYEALRRAHATLFGRTEIPEYRLDGCDFILSLGADYLETWLSPVQYASRFGDLHALQDGSIGTFVYVGPRLSMTAGNADEFISLEEADSFRFAVAVLRALLDSGRAGANAEPIRAACRAFGWERITPPAGVPAAKVQSVAAALAAARRAVALAGPVGGEGPLAIHTAMAAALLNCAVGAIGSTVAFDRPHALSKVATAAELDRFLDSLTADDVLLIHAANPAYAAPATRRRLRRAGLIVHLATQPDETADLADWVLPIHSPLESWGDYTPMTGVENLQQPTLQPLYDTRQAGDVLLDLAQAAGQPLARPGAAAPAHDFLDWIQQRWQTVLTAAQPAAPFAQAWDDALRRGGVWTQPQDGPVVELQAAVTPPDEPLPQAPTAESADRLRLWLWPSIMLFDGRVANRGWLQEAPDPVSTFVWGDGVAIHPATAQRLAVRAGDIVALENAQGAVEAPAFLTEDVLPGHAALSFGQGHTALGHLAAGVGPNAFALLAATAADASFGNVSVRKTGRAATLVPLSATQDQSGRRILQWVGLDQAKRLQPGEGEPLIMPLPEGYDERRDLYPPHRYAAHRWAMVADLQRCIGCGACAVACYAENNIAVMGHTATAQGREMAWLKIVPYRQEGNARRIGWLPIMCQQCDAAPCEPVCPVFASVHNEEGLNAQVYNRCVGTRYCSNNCPYKVRRFNWLNVAWPESLRLQLNPDVTVRTRGVMEKCTFCVQRIRAAENEAARERRAVRDGEIQPACVQSCPTRALIFGDLLDPAARVTRLTRTDPRRYHVLEDLNTKPAVTYLRRIDAGA